MIVRNLLYCLCLTIAAAGTAAAGTIDSAYTKLDLDKDCTFTASDNQGGYAVCAGYKEWTIHFSEGDLRQQVRFGIIDPDADRWESFSEFNHINDTVEWRLESGKPFATILRWFVENMNPDTGAADKKNRGNVLVISTVGTMEDPGSCIIGYVDARANNNANELARDVADRLAGNFECGRDQPRFHGVRGKWSGNPTSLAE